MSLEEGIVLWSLTRPPWQRAVLRRVATEGLLSDNDYDQLVDNLLRSKVPPLEAFSLAHLPQADVGDPPVRLVSIADPEHVNALASEWPLTFQAVGLTIIYGDNGSGKSGYARLLKRVARARHREEILSDVFHDTALAKPQAVLTVSIGDDEKSLAWPESTLPELQRMLFYDEACGKAYVDTESDFPYRPSALFVMDGLIEACVAIRNRIDTKLDENARSKKELPLVDEDAKGTEVGRYLAQLSRNSSLEALDSLIATPGASTQTIVELKSEEARLLSADTNKERQRLTRQSAKLTTLQEHLDKLQEVLGDDGVTALQEQRDRLRSLEEAAEILAKSFESEPIPGVGTSSWKELWESARRFSKAHAYPDDEFPVVNVGADCVLCQQPLTEEARDRLSRFERFIRDDTQAKLRETSLKWNRRLESITELRITPDALETNLQDLEAEHAELVLTTRELLGRYQAALRTVLDSLPGRGNLSHLGFKPEETNTRLEEAAQGVRAAADGLSDREKIKARLAEVTTSRKELELLQKFGDQREVIASEIARLKDRYTLEMAKNSAATGPITKKILGLTEDNITEVVRDTFTRETERLRLERVTMTKTRGDLGAVLHQPKLVGARQSVTLPRVFSEGERTALGLAAFFTEANLDASKSALVLDDPVSSLDHKRTELVATRLAELAESRQVVVFTHDVSFVFYLKRAAERQGVPVADRSVVRGRRGEKQPGTCNDELPWKAKDVSQRLGELRQELAQFRKKHQEWDDPTYEKEVAAWAGGLSETWERIFSQELVGQILADGGLEVRPRMVKVLGLFSPDDDRAFQASYSRVSLWAKRHDKSPMLNYVPPEIDTLEHELDLVHKWFRRIKTFKNL